MAIGYFIRLFDFSLMKEYATRKPPMKKNTSTARKAPVTNTKKSFSTIVGIPTIFESFLSLTEKRCPNITHIMQIVLIPLKMLR